MRHVVLSLAALLQALEQASAFGAGVRALGLPARAVVAIFADTSLHWLLAAYGCFLEARAMKTKTSGCNAAELLNSS
jgi:long-subunit acyl-CoA synthetase (AMP-forming)